MRVVASALLLPVPFPLLFNLGVFFGNSIPLAGNVLVGFFEVVHRGWGARGDIRTVILRGGWRNRLREPNLKLQVVLWLLYLEVGHGLPLNWDFRLKTLFLTEFLIFDVKLVVMDSVHGLLGGFSEKHTVEQVLQHEVDGLVSGLLSELQLFAVHFDLGPGFDFLLFLLLAEGRTDIRLVVVGRLPEHTHERVPVLLCAPLFPVLNYLLFTAYLRQLLVYLRIAVLLQKLHHLQRLFRFVHKGTLLEGVDHTLQLFLREANAWICLQKLAVTLSDFIILRSKVKH